MVPRIFREGICSPSKFRRLHNKLVTRGFCKTEWTKPKHVHKPYTEHRSDLPLVVQNTPGHKSVRYVELWKAWFTIEYEIFNAFAKNGNFTTCCLCYHNKNDRTKTDKNIEKNLNDEVTNRRHLDAILRAYSELQAFTSPTVKKSGFAMIEETCPGETFSAKATLNATTRNLEEEKLTQKLETIEEVPLVEADPDVIKPPQTSGPAVMNMSSSDCEEFGKHSDFQIGDDPESEPLMHCQEEQPATPNIIRSYFEKEDCNKPNINDLITLNAVPDVNEDEELSLMDLMKRVRERNRLLRCRDIECQLNASTTDDSVMAGRTGFPQRDNNPSPHSPPTWAWPHPQPHNNPHEYSHPFPMYPHVANPHPRKAEPITPDNRPGYNKATKVNPVTLALYLGPLVTALRNACILFPVLAASLIPFKNLETDGNKKPGVDTVCVLRSSCEKDSEED
ncbi:uncharacterized protein LOC134659433 [Cydia amplana]|uniref:uncharacterized protein LOC134659433 n=1 Tax=Cydia amplana TaxID=1869771 RepID=UPI002FE536B1